MSKDAIRFEEFKKLANVVCDNTKKVLDNNLHPVEVDNVCREAETALKRIDSMIPELEEILITMAE